MDKGRPYRDITGEIKNRLRDLGIEDAELSRLLHEIDYNEDGDPPAWKNIRWLARQEKDKTAKAILTQGADLMEQQHRLIVELERIIDEALYAEGWTACSDRLPETGGRYLVDMGFEGVTIEPFNPKACEFGSYEHEGKKPRHIVRPDRWMKLPSQWTETKGKQGYWKRGKE